MVMSGLVGSNVYALVLMIIPFNQVAGGSILDLERVDVRFSNSADVDRQLAPERALCMLASNFCATDVAELSSQGVRKLKDPPTENAWA